MTRDQDSHTVSSKTHATSQGCYGKITGQNCDAISRLAIRQTLPSLAVNIRSSYIFANPQVVFYPIVFTKANEITHLFGYQDNMITFIYQQAFPLLVNSLLSTSLLDGSLNSETKDLLNMLQSYALVQPMTVILNGDVKVQKNRKTTLPFFSFILPQSF